MSKTKKVKPVIKPEHEIFSELVRKVCDKYGTKNIADSLGLSLRAVQGWKKDASKVNKVAVAGTRFIFNQMYPV